MASDPPSDEVRKLTAAAWRLIGEERYEEAEGALRDLIGRVGEGPRLAGLFGALGGVLNTLGRSGEATEALRRAWTEARDGKGSEALIARYELASHLLVHGDPDEVLRLAYPIPEGRGHLQSRFHAVAAQALWKVAYPHDARMAAQDALVAAPTGELRSELTVQLRAILES
jgi:hypothetical protein